MTARLLYFVIASQHQAHKQSCLCIYSLTTRCFVPLPILQTPCCAQGKFKQALPFNAVLSGQHFSGPLQHLPASWLTSTILKLVHHINPTMVVGTVSSPSLLAPLVSMAQCITVSQPGMEPSLTASPIEDMRLLGSHFQSPSGKDLRTI